MRQRLRERAALAAGRGGALELGQRQLALGALPTLASRLDQLFQGSGGGGAPSVDKAREQVREQPRNPEALRKLADALQQNGRPDEAIAPLDPEQVSISPEVPFTVDADRDVVLVQLQRALDYGTTYRVTCVSTTTPMFLPKALPSTTFAVFRPTPWRSTSSSIVSGTLPP